MTIQLQDQTFKQLRDFIYEKSGIFIPDSKKYLIENRLSRRLEDKGLKGYEEYLSLLKNNNEELVRLFDAITTNETYFFREDQQIDVLVNYLIPKIQDTKGSKDIKVWSAACSTGEEPYSIAMVFLEKIPGLKFEIFASDISESVLSSARKAIYTSYSVRNVPPALLNKYFSRNGQMLYELNPSLKKFVNFSNINLMDEKRMRSIKGIDVIFCRNVLIYFDDRAKQKVVSLLYDSLRPGGYLFVGTSESLHNVTRAFRPLIFNKVIVYQKV
ncbi:MAG: CheR family methyltransferase [Thermodesulfovibrionales bacterium]